MYSLGSCQPDAKTDPKLWFVNGMLRPANPKGFQEEKKNKTQNLFEQQLRTAVTEQAAIWAYRF